MDNNDLKLICKIDNAVEADFLIGLFSNESVLIHLKSFYDTAYDGLFVAAQGYGELYCTEKDFDKAAGLYEDYKNSIFK